MAKLFFGNRVKLFTVFTAIWINLSEEIAAEFIRLVISLIPYCFRQSHSFRSVQNLLISFSQLLPQKTNFGPLPTGYR